MLNLWIFLVILGMLCMSDPTKGVVLASWAKSERQVLKDMPKSVTGAD